MFYSHLVLTKKGLLGRVWLAAQLGEGRIPKQFACDAQIDILCRNIEKPVAPFALRLSAHLMLGVTRVYSRKSTIILSDVNRVLGALQKLDANAFDLISPRRRKRSRVSVNRIADITLQSGKEAIARFETITFPSPKRTRRRSVDTTFKNITFLEGLSGKPTAISEELDGVIDLDSHLDMHFPTIHIGQMDMRSGSVDPENILSQSSPIFRAREQDITLPPSADLAFGSDLNLIDLDLDPFHADVSLSVEANTDGTPHNVSQEKFDDGSDEFRAAFAQNLSSTPIRSSGDGSAIMTMLNPAPLADPVEVSKQNVLGARGPLGTTKTSIQSIGRRRNRGTGERIKKRRSSTGTKRTSKRSARILSPNLIITDQTELSVQFLRDCLRDTSDIVLSPGSIRPIGRRKKLPEETLESILMRSNPLGNSIPEVREFWTNVMVKPFLGLPKSPANSNESEGPDQIPHPSISTSPPKPMGHDQQSVHYDPVRIGTPPTQMEEVLELTLEEDEIARNALKATDVIKSGSSNKERSIPSDQSGSGPSGGLSFAQSSSLESKAPEILRDNELEKITAEDHDEFAKARRISADFRTMELTKSITPGKNTSVATPKTTVKELSNTQGQQDYSVRRRESHAGSDLDLEADIELNDEMIPVLDSDLRLEEQTEDLFAVANDGMSAIEHLNVRAFKILKIIRNVAFEKRVSTDQPITTVSENNIPEIGRILTLRQSLLRLCTIVQGALLLECFCMCLPSLLQDSFA